jgi:hypothetical protein
LEYFTCEIIKPIKRRSTRTALNKNKSMNKVLSVHTCAEQCLYQSLRDGQCYNGQDPSACKEFKQRASGIVLERITTELKGRLRDSIVLQYQEQAEQNKVSISTDPEVEEVFTRQIPFPPMTEERKQVSPASVVSYVWFDPKNDKITKTKKVDRSTHWTGLNQVTTGAGLANGNAPRSLCTKCGEWVRYPHDPKTLMVECWLCVTKEVLACENKKPKEKSIDGRSEDKRFSNRGLRSGFIRHDQKPNRKVKERKKPAPRKTVGNPKGILRRGPDKMVDGS